MDTLIGYAGGVVLVLWMAAGLVLAVTAAGVYVVRFVRTHRGVAATVTCPRTGAPTRVRIGPRGPGRELAVLSCECVEGGTTRCGRECFPRWAALAGMPATVRGA